MDELTVEMFEIEDKEDTLMMIKVFLLYVKRIHYFD
ncbi:Protein of unknown function [Bacillus toyonensis]|nr:hypothetical protein [Bacillus sp. JUb91]SCN15175.1 Protein of unknown function [Bacillus toyonensis]